MEDIKFSFQFWETKILFAGTYSISYSPEALKL